MRFHQVFKRTKAQLVDPIPTDPPGPGKDNILSAVTYSGQPVHRVAIVYKPPSGTLALDMSIYVWEGLLKQWVQLATGTGNLLANQFIYFDFPSVAERVMKPSDDASERGSPGLDVYVRVLDPGAAPAGDHLIAMAAITNQKGF